MVNKPAGQLVQGDQTGDTPLLETAKMYLKDKYQKPGKVFLGLVHRLDRPTSGVLVFARTSKALTRLNAQFKNRDTEKVYRAIVEGRILPSKQRLEHWLVRKPKQNKSYAYPKEVPDSKKAVLSYASLVKMDRYTGLEIALETGRHHQIRAQLSALGHPIKGDLKYTAKRSNKGGNICLHAYKLSLTHPVKKERMEFCAPLPTEDLWTLFPAD